MRWTKSSRDQLGRTRKDTRGCLYSGATAMHGEIQPESHTSVHVVVVHSVASDRRGVRRSAATDPAGCVPGGPNTSVPEQYFVVVFHRSMPDPEDCGSGRRAAGPVAQRHAKRKRWSKNAPFRSPPKSKQKNKHTNLLREETLCYCRDVSMAWSIRHRARKISSVLHLTCALTVATWSRVTQDGTTHAIPSWPSWKV